MAPRRSCVMAAAATLIAAPGSAASLLNLEDARMIEETYDYCSAPPNPVCDSLTLDQIFSSAAQFSAASGSGAVSQDSHIAADALSGTGSAGWVSDPGPNGEENLYTGRSVFDVAFHLDAESVWRLSAVLDSSSDRSFVQLCNPDCVDNLLFYRTVFSGSQSVDEVVTLAPGDYRLRLSASSLSSLPGTASWSFSFTEVPEPASALAVGLGLAALGASRRRAGRVPPERGHR